MSYKFVKIFDSHKQNNMTYKKKQQFFPEDYIMEDYIVEILLKLPIKSLLRFRCVSKSWYALSISSYFVNTHMKLNEKTKFLLINTAEDKFLSFNLKDESFVSVLNSRLEIDGDLVGYCNGIICFQSGNYDIILLNPSMREFKVLPNFAHLLDIHFGLGRVGFGFDDLNDDYKVILIINARKALEVIIYNFRSNTWRKLENKNINTLCTTSERVIVSPIKSTLFFNGRVHWDAHHTYYNDDHKRKTSHSHYMILSMDTSSEVFYEFQYPEPVLLWKNKNTSYLDLSYNTDLQVIRGSLSVILFHMLDPYQVEGEYIHIWSMKEYGIIESWTKQYTIGPFFSIVCALPIRENEDEEDHLVLQIGTHKLPNRCELFSLLSIFPKRCCEFVRWNLSKNEKVQKYSFKGFFYTYMKVLCYSQSLVSIGKNYI